jgi:diacylglycerol kinase (ATP)
MERHRLIDSFNCAVEGIIYVLKTQRNMRIHFAVGALVLVLALVLDLSRVDFLFICIAIFMMLFAEMVNTAAELTIDLISETYHPLARLVKDIGAGAALLAAINSVVIGYLVFSRYMEGPALSAVDSVRSLPLHVTFLALMIVMMAAVGMKIAFRRGTPMRGGMPSAHSAVAFSAATVVMLLVPTSFLTFMLAYFLAFMVMQCRVAAGIHTVSEALLGALLGIGLTLLLYQVYRCFG